MADAPQTTLLQPPSVPPVSAAEALSHLDVMIRLTDLWEDKRGQMASVMQTWGAWMRQIRPHLAEAAARSNDHGA